MEPVKPGRSHRAQSHGQAGNVTRCSPGDRIKDAGISSEKMRIKMTREPWCWGQDRKLAIKIIMSEQPVADHRTAQCSLADIFFFPQRKYNSTNDDDRE